ncbi:MULTISPECIES: ABC transporter permease [unclassified Rhizobium]|uniref:ABC transporter permease n=1 Tax=unclassified Rhizobium TaxID=2613769 RepID=UPI0006F52B6B|nr:MULTISPECIES: ABC transporter permease [unclassified Rhizobium]KQV41408.1 D-ala-D-ala transporter subunit [Rhizobium sp. Root1212]KRD37042.1 D-ala-D-ala transporter subunit [Rhizobium sp. Root268]
MKKLVHRLGIPGSIALAIVTLFVLVAILAPWIAPYPLQGAGAPNVIAKLQPPSASYWLGTDHLGRDILSRIIYGTRVSLTNGLLIVAFSLLIGLPVGLAAGYFGGWIDEALMRGTDVFLAFPALLLAVLMAAALGPGFLNSIIAVAVTWWPWYARLARAEVLVLRGQPYVEAARLSGVSHPRIIIRHILPATGRPLTVQAALDVGPALLTAAALSFLGLGILPPTADWGQMVDAGRKFFPARWWYSAMPGMTIFIIALAFSVLGDALRDRKGGASRASA